jgi:hypothetical protein
MSIASVVDWTIQKARSRYGMDNLPPNNNVNPEKLFTIRASGQGILNVSVPKARLKEAAKALFYLMQQNPLKSKSEIVVDAVIIVAKLIYENENLGNLFRENLLNEED